MFSSKIPRLAIAQPTISLFTRSSTGTTVKRCLIGQPLCRQKHNRLYSTAQKSTPPPPPPPLSSSPSPQTFTWKSAVVLGMTAVGLVVYFRGEKEKLRAQKAKRERDTIKAMGRPHIGQPFELFNVNENKRTTSEELMNGQFTMIYFGFTHCPDICPEELDKMAQVVDAVKEEFGGNVLTPVFITCDPLRDTADVVREYVQDFHPDLVGFTGSPEELKRVARSYRVYSYLPPNVSADDDYLVDHSIFIYLMDPQGKFIDCYARDTTSEQVLHSFKNYMKDYLEDGGKLKSDK
ncbi:SCO1/SenC-domain-containing protein [Parasitella parasitica]|nr:SCO1/SenC-domain-containing protein [Parasitella parasitica]